MTQLSDKWIKASILGTIWASSEIVLGSFLHNLRIPFSGNILTAIGLIILISANYKWKEKGLFWRAGVICALMKTMSPSAVIFGPMIAITSEAFLLEFSVRILGRTIPAFILGSVLAMSWNLVQRIFNYIIFYGYNIVEVYTNLMQYAEKQLQLKFDAVWAPLFLLLIAYALFGAFAALVGIRTGRKLMNSKETQNLNFSNNRDNTNRKKKEFPYSLFWLIMNIVLMFGTLILIGRIPFGIWVIIVVIIAIAWAFRYKRALRQLVRPKLWIFFILITMIAAFVFSQLQAETTSVMNAMLIGVEMNLRAIILIMGFSVLGTELYHPKIRYFFSNSYFRQLFLALELSLDSLPEMIANTPDVRTLLKNPVKVIHHMMIYAELRLDEVKSFGQKPKSIFVTGEVESGKTRLIKEVVSELRKENFSISGFYSERIMKNGQTTGYDVVNILSGEKVKFLRTEGNSTQSKIGKYYIYPKALTLFEKASRNNSDEIFLLDEVGRLELQEKGWYNVLQHMANESKKHLLLVVREEVIDEVAKKFGLKPVAVFRVENYPNEELRRELIHALKTL